MFHVEQNLTNEIVLLLQQTDLHPLGLAEKLQTNHMTIARELRHLVDARRIYNSPHAVAVVITLKPGESLKKHITLVDVFFYVLEGRGVVEIGNEMRTIVKDMLVESPARIPYKWTNESIGNFWVLVIKVPKPTKETKLLSSLHCEHSPGTDVSTATGAKRSRAVSYTGTHRVHPQKTPLFVPKEDVEPGDACKQIQFLCFAYFPDTTLNWHRSQYRQMWSAATSTSGQVLSLRLKTRRKCP